MMEERIRKEIEGHFKSKMNHRETALFREMRKFNEFKTDMVDKVLASASEDQEAIKDMIRKRTDQFKNDPESPGKYLVPRVNA